MAIRVLTHDEVRRLLEQPQASNLLGSRDRAIMETLSSTGIQVGELLALNRDDIDFLSERLHIMKDKQNRVVPIGQAALSTIQSYLKIRRESGKEERTLFLTETGKRIDRSTVSRIMIRHSKSARFEPPLTAKVLRATFAVHLLQEGADEKEVRRLLGIGTKARMKRYTEIAFPSEDKK